MSLKTLTRSSAIGTGLEAELAALRSPEPVSLTVEPPPEDLQSLAENGESLVFDAFTTEDIQELGHLLHARLRNEPRPALISISLANGLVVYQATTGPGVKPDNDTWVQRKRRSVHRWGVSTWMLHCKYKGDEAAFAAKFGMSTEQASQYAIHGGGMPVYIQGVEGLVAVVVVSGLKQFEDHGVIMDTVNAHWQAV